MFTNNLIAGASGQGGSFYPYAIDQSLRLNDNDSAYLSRSPASDTNRKTWTWSGWIKRGAWETNADPIFTARSGLNFTQLIFGDNEDIYLNQWNGSPSWTIGSNRVFRDASAWYHIVASFDSTQATSTNRVKLYVNGEQITSLASTSYPSQNQDSFINSTTTHFIGSYGGGEIFDGYMAEINFIDGQALDPTDFGEFKSGVWVAKEYTGSYGTNGFYLNFSDSGAIGDDLSGNANDWTANNLAATDVVLDSPTNNFATMNFVDIYDAGCLLSEGNLKVSNNATTWAVRSTFAANSGKWYWEQTGTNQTNGTVGGRAGGFTSTKSTAAEQDVFGMFWHPTAGIYTVINGSFTVRGSGTNYGDNDIIAQALDLDNNIAYWYKNGVLAYTYDFSSHVPVGSEYFAPYSFNGSTGTPINTYNFGQDSSFAGAKTAQGNTDANGVGDFYHSVPSGFLALAASNLPNPAIDPAQDDVPADYFNTVLGTGTGSTQSVSVGFQPDFLWIKRRDAAINHALYDAIRGGTNALRSNTTAAESQFATDTVITYEADGFEIAGGATSGFNGSGDSFVAWNWLAGNGTSSNTDGSITSTVSVNQKAGFSIVSYTGTNSATETVGHGLGATPSMVIVKTRDSADFWPVYHSGVDATAPENYLMRLNTTDARLAGSAYWNNTAPTSSVFTIGTSSALNNTDDFIAYCFAPVESYSAFGSYTGNGSTDGPMIWTGHSSAFLMVKRTDSSGDWYMFDKERATYNVVTTRLWANLSSAELSSSVVPFDFLSNGFKVRNSDASFNASGGSYIYLSFASNPFKYANAR